MDKIKMTSLLAGYEYLFRKGYVYDFNYIVNIGPHMLGFSKISNLSTKCDVEMLREGGGGRNIRLKKGGDELETLILERGVARIPANIFESKYRTGFYIRDLLIMVLNGKKLPEMGFYFEEGVITSRKYSDLNASSGSILMLTMEIKHTGLEEIII